MIKRYLNTSLTFLLIIQFFFIFKIVTQYTQAYTLQNTLTVKREALNVLDKDLYIIDLERKRLYETIDISKLENIDLIKENNQFRNKVLLKNKSYSYIANIPESKVVYLTFDDGPSKNTLNILSILDKYNIKATFFVNGSTSKSFNNTYKTIKEKGHTIGNHTYSHNYSKIYRSVEDFAEDFNKLQSFLKNSLGASPKIARLPGGSNNRISHKYGGASVMTRISKYLLDNGYTYFDWNIDSHDAAVKLQSKSTIVHSVLNKSKNKSAVIILLHDNSLKTTTVEALPEIIEGLIHQGFEFRSLSPHEYTTQFLRAN